MYDVSDSEHLTRPKGAFDGSNSDHMTAKQMTTIDR